MSIEYNPNVGAHVYIFYTKRPKRFRRIVSTGKTGYLCEGSFRFRKDCDSPPKIGRALFPYLRRVFICQSVLLFGYIRWRVCICISMGLLGMGAIIAGYFHNDLMVTTDARYRAEIRETCWCRGRLPEFRFFCNS